MNPDAFQAPTLEELAPLFPNYSIDAFIAQGGMGAVYLATQTSLERQVAIKILPREFGADPEFRKSFAAEAKAMAKLNHPNLLGVYDFGEVDGMPFIVMEYVAGKPLHDSAYGLQIDPAEAARIVMETCHGLHHAHDHGILHRDVKPANILLDPINATPKLGDFGLAMATTDDNDDGLIYGTPGYAAPEVYEGNPDARSDVYAAAVILYQLLTGDMPGNPYQHPSELANCCHRYDALLAQALQPDAADRFQTAAEFADELDAIQKAPAPVDATASPPPSFHTETTLPSAKKSGTAPMIGAIAALLVLGGGFFFLQSNKKEKNAAQSSESSPTLLPHENPESVLETPSSEAPPASVASVASDPTPTVEPAVVVEPEEELVEVVIAEESEVPAELVIVEEAAITMEEVIEPVVTEQPPVPPAPVSTFDHLAFLKRGRDYCSKNGSEILAEYQEELIKNIDSLEREGKAILRKEEYITRDAERERKANLEATVETYRKEGRLPSTLVSAKPAAFIALTFYNEVTEKALREALVDQREIEKEMKDSLLPLAEVYAKGVSEKAGALKSEGNDYDAGILMTEAKQALDDPAYFLKIVNGEDPLPEGLTNDPAHMPTSKLIVGEWKSESTNTVFTFNADGTSESKKPTKTGVWRIEGEKVVADWGGDKQDYLIPTPGNPNQFLAKYRNGELVYFNRATPLVTDPIVGQWEVADNSKIIFTFDSDKSVNNGTGNKHGKWQKTEDSYLISWNNGVSWRFEMEDSKILHISRQDGTTNKLVRK